MFQDFTDKYKRLVRTQRFKEGIRKIILPGSEGIPLYDIIIKFREEVTKADISIRASSISFYFILSIFPGIIFFFSLIPYIPFEHLDEIVMKGLKDLLPQDAFLLLETTIKDILSIQSGGLVSVNFFLSLFMASNAVNSIMKAFDKINDHEEERTFWQKRFSAFRLMLLITLQIIIALLLIIKGKEILLMIINILPTKTSATYILLRISKDILILLSFYNIINVIYYYGLSNKQNFKYFSAGTTFATLFSISISIIFQVYTSFLNNFNRLYGSLGIMIVIMMLIYLNAMVLLFGFELNNSIIINKKLKEEDSKKQSN